MDSGDKHQVFSMATIALLAFYEAAKAAIAVKDPEKVARIEETLRAGTADLVMSVRQSGGQIRASLALVASTAGEPFDPPLINLSGPIEAAAMPRGRVNAINLDKLN